MSQNIIDLHNFVWERLLKRYNQEINNFLHELNLYLVDVKT